MPTREKSKELIITIDGPAGAGKSVTARKLAKKLGYLYLDTGALYRVLAYKMDQEGVAADNSEAVRQMFEEIKIKFKEKNGELQPLLDDQDLSDKIRSPRISLLASRISTLPQIREVLLDIQRQAGVSGGIVAEGRDLGTVVFPHADLKFFLTADPDVRAQRRFQELKKRGEKIDVERVKQETFIRDHSDTTRYYAPLKKAEDAIEVDTTDLVIEEVIEKLYRLYLQKKESSS